MPVRHLHQFDSRKTLQIRFKLGPRELLAPAAIGQNLLQVALEAGMAIEHACGGEGACSTCHVYVNRGGERLSEMTDKEADRLDVAPQVGPRSRLACQAVIISGQPGTVEIEVEVPAWNINVVGEV